MPNTDDCSYLKVLVARLDKLRITIEKIGRIKVSGKGASISDARFGITLIY